MSSERHATIPAAHLFIRLGPGASAPDLDPVPLRNHNGSVTITLKNIPPGLHARLKASAARNRRSLNSEILARLESDPLVARAGEGFARDLAAFTASLPRLDYRLVDKLKRQGRT